MATINFLGILALALAGLLTSTSAILPKGFRVLNSPDGTRDSYFFIISKNPTGTQRICESISTYRFISLDDESKASELYLKLSYENVSEVWTSGNDILHNSQYVWAALDNTPFGPFQHWRTKYENGTARPPNNPDCHCVSVSARECGSKCAGQWFWDEEKCSSYKMVVCEPKIKPEPNSPSMSTLLTPKLCVSHLVFLFMSLRIVLQTLI